MPFTLGEEDLKDEEILCEKLMDLASIVYTRHFYANVSEKQDLLSVGLLKALSLIRGGNWDPVKGKLLTYLYTGMRNEMHNYIYRISREVLMDHEYLENRSVKEIESDDTSFLNIRYEVVLSVCSDFDCYGELASSVVDNLNDLGFKVIGADSSNGGDFPDTYCPSFYSDLIQRLSGAVLWKNRESYL